MPRFSALLPTDASTLSTNQCVSWYLTLSYLYYGLDESLVDDHVFDAICVRLSREWDSITHPHKEYLDRKALYAGTGYHVPFMELPTIILSASWRLLNETRGQ